MDTSDEISSVRPDVAARALHIIHALIAEIGRQDRSAFLADNVHAVSCDDGSVFVEWIRPDRRIGFGVELDPAEDGWHFVSKKPEAESGSIGTADIPMLVRRMLT